MHHYQFATVLPRNEGASSGKDMPSDINHGGPLRDKMQTRFGRRSQHTAAFTLVEVMVAATLFTMIAMSVGGLFVQNSKISATLRYRSNATNAALNLLEQIRTLNFTDLTNIHNASATIPGAYIRVLVTDPNAPDHSSLPHPDPTLPNAGNPTGIPGVGTSNYASDTSVPVGYQNVDLVINVRDGVILPPLNANWNYFSVPLSSTPSAPRMAMRIWLTFNYNTAISGDASVTAPGQAFEIALVYQWQQPGAPSTASWESATVRAVLVNQNPQTIGS